MSVLVVWREFAANVLRVYGKICINTEFLLQFVVVMFLFYVVIRMYLCPSAGEYRDLE